MKNESGRKINSDLYRYYGNISRKTFYYSLMFNTGFRYSFFLRKCEGTRKGKLFWRFLLWRTRTKYHIHIFPETKIGYGLRIDYGEFVTISQHSNIGNNLTIYHGAVIGTVARGDRIGAPTIGNNVWIGTHAVVVGKIFIGDNVLIAPLTHVNFDIPDNAVVAGNPGKIISFSGTEGYVINEWNNNSA
jgi:serine O-acetyltransferase